VDQTILFQANIHHGAVQSRLLHDPLQAHLGPQIREGERPGIGMSSSFICHIWYSPLLFVEHRLMSYASLYPMGRKSQCLVDCPLASVSAPGMISSVSFLERAMDVPLGISLGKDLAFVVFAPASCQRNLDLGAPPLEVQARGDNGVAALTHARGEAVDLSTVKQELARATGLMAVPPCLLIGRDVNVEQPEFPVSGLYVPIGQVDPAGPNRLDLCPGQDQAGFAPILQVEVSVGLPICGDDFDA